MFPDLQNNMFCHYEPYLYKKKKTWRMHSLLKYPIYMSCFVCCASLIAFWNSHVHVSHITCAQLFENQGTGERILKYDPEVTDLIMDNQKFHVAKAVFIDVSSVFGKMLAGKFKEKKTSELELPGKKHSSFELFLLCMFLRR